MASKSKGESPKKGRPSKKRATTKSVPAKTKKTPAKGAKTAGSKRKPNRYNTLRKAISEYCWRKYKYRCTNEEINRIYRELKARYFDVDPKKQVSPAELARTIDSRLKFKDENDVPDDLKTFNWFDIETFLREQDKLFFKSDDTITIQFAGLAPDVTFQMGELSNAYGNSIYPTMRQILDEYENQYGQRASPPPFFSFDSKQSNPKKRQFTWALEIDSGIAALTPAPAAPPAQAPPAAPAAPAAASDEQELLKQREKTAQAEERVLKAKLELIREGRELLKEGVITADEFKRHFLDS